MYDVAFTETCTGFWCLVQGVNSLTDGWLAVGLLFVIWVIAFVARISKQPDDYINGLIIANFSVLVFAFLFFLGGIFKGEYIIIPVLLLSLTLLLKKIVNN